MSAGDKVTVAGQVCLVRRVLTPIYGVPVVEVITPAGRRVLVLLDSPAPGTIPGA